MAGMIQSNSRIYVAGHAGLVGSALVRRLRKASFGNLVLCTREELDLTARDAVFRMFEQARPEFVFMAAARVGGIAANMASPVEFLVENLDIQNNLLLACAQFRVVKTFFLGSSCIYPRAAAQPMREDDFMTGPLEPTNESYAIAKIAGIRLARALREERGLNVICAMPSNVYGPGDHFDLTRAHVASALARRFSEAKQKGAPAVGVWGTGSARRELLHVDDLADACLFLMDHYDSPELVNIGTGEDVTIRELAETIGRLVKYQGEIQWDATKPDGMPRKVLDVSRLHGLGWRHSIGFEDGLRSLIGAFEKWQAGSKAESA